MPCLPRAPRAPLNDNRPATSGLLIGLTGLRNVGKSTVADLLVEEFGFVKVHAFDGGKYAAREWFRYVTDDEDVADRMVFGDLKDKPSRYLPGGVAPRLLP